MLKLLIVDDERIIRDTISQLIHWKDLDINLIGTAENGLEALNIIIDEAPEIVMTDIKMPGLSGLELIHRVSTLNTMTQFIVLSGYGEFEYAKEAMRYGVRHYLLKPCNESQIMETILEIKKNFSLQKFEKSRQPLYHTLNQGIVFNIVNDAISVRPINYSDIYKKYSNFIDLKNVAYTLFYVFYLEHKFAEKYIKVVDNIFLSYGTNIPHFYIYVKNTLLFFYPSDMVDSSMLFEKLSCISFENTRIKWKYEYYNFLSLSDLFNTILPKISRYETIYLVVFESIIPISNNDSIINQVDYYITKLLSTQSNPNEILQNMISIFDSVQSMHFLQQLGNIIFAKIMTYRNVNELFDNEQFFMELYNCSDVAIAKNLLYNRLQNIFPALPLKSQSKDTELSARIKQYVCAHLEDPNLSLKWISDHILFMNSDYVSKRFIKETGEKFSHYIIRKRIESAKQLLLSQKELNVQEVAQRIGCGNNPLYFSQLFKKYTGMTPSTFYKKNKHL